MLDVFNKIINACDKNTCLDLIVFEEFYNKLHVSVHLGLLSDFDLLFIKHIQHLFVEVTLFASLVTNLRVNTGINFIKTCSSCSTITSLFFQHLIELLLATSKQQLAEVHFNIVLVIESSEKKNTESNVILEISTLCCSLHKDNLHELVQKTWCVIKVLHNLIFDGLKVLLS